MSNTEIWDKLKRVPPEHLKGFQRAGGFKGTAIKPMWTIHRMTEVFGPIGKGWGTDEPQFQVVPGDNKEMLVYCTVCVWVTDSAYVAAGRFYGVGGDKVVKHIPANAQYNRPERWENDDEAFKKAYTDALTNALKMLGAGADVHMGLWDGNKYVDEKPEPPRATKTVAAIDTPEDYAPVMVASNGTKGSSKAASREPYDRMVKEIRNQPSVKALEDWYKDNFQEIEKMDPDFVDELRVEYKDRLSELKRGLAA